MNKELRAELGRIALQLSWTDRQLLDFVARHPFLSKEDLALVFQWEPAWARQRRNKLIRLDLMRLVTADEVGEEMAERDLVEVTYKGLLLVAAHQGLSLAMAVRYNGLAGGGSDEPIGARENLVRYFAHTLGVNAVCLGWYRVAQHSVERGSNDKVLDWQNSAACSRKILRPDGYIEYRHAGQPFGVFVEYDRGKMSYRDHRDKFRIYVGYIERRLYERDYQGMPKVLVITTNETAEARIARAVQSVVHGRGVEVPVLITCEGHIHDPHNPDSLLGPIWRTPDTTAHDQYCRSPDRTRS